MRQRHHFLIASLILLGIAGFVASLGLFGPAVARYAQPWVDTQALFIDGTEVTSTAAELNKLDGATATKDEINYLDVTSIGTVEASKAVIVDGNKDAGDFRNLDGVNLDAGSSGTAGTVDVFPSSASSGKVALTAADSAGDYTTTIVNASQAAARTYTIPDAGGAANFVLLTSAQDTAGELVRADLTLESLAVVGVSLTNVKNSDGTSLAASASSGSFGISSGDWGTGTLTLDGEAASGASVTDTCMFEFVLPENYVADEDVKLIVEAKESVGAATTSTTLSAQVYESDGQGGVSADLYNAFDTTDITTSWQTCTAVITDAALVPGDRLVMFVRIVTDDSTGSVGTIAQIGKIELQCDVKG